MDSLLSPRATLPIHPTLAPSSLFVATLSYHALQVLLYPSSWLKTTGDLGHWETLLRARALDHQVFVVGVSNPRDAAAHAADPTVPLAFGRSSVVGPLGETLGVCADDATDEVVSAELRLDALLDARRRIPLAASRRPQAYQGALDAARQWPGAMMRPPPLLGNREP